jgi:hypothetical protein
LADASNRTSNHDSPEGPSFTVRAGRIQKVKVFREGSADID